VAIACQRKGLENANEEEVEEGNLLGIFRQALQAGMDLVGLAKLAAVELQASPMTTVPLLSADPTKTMPVELELQALAVELPEDMGFERYLTAEEPAEDLETLQALHSESDQTLQAKLPMQHLGLQTTKQE